VLKVLRVSVLGGLMGLCLSAAGAAAQQPPASPYVDLPVRTVSVTIDGRPSTEPALLEAVQTKVGAPLRMADVRETITHLYSFGRFSDVQVNADRTADAGVALRFELAPIQTVTRVRFTGQLGLSEGAVRSRMSERFGQTPALSRASEVAAWIGQVYQEHGYLGATVTVAPPVIEHDPERATLVFDIASGPRTTIARSTIGGKPLDAAARILSRLRIEPGDPYAPGQLQTRLSELVASMRHRGYYQAAASVQPPAFNADRTQVDLTVDVLPGPLVTVQFAGDPLPKDKIAELVPVEREGSVDEDLLEDSATRIADYLHQQGYWKAEVKTPERREAPGRLTIVFTIHRGLVYRVAPGGVEVTGNRSVTSEELKPLLKIGDGDLFVSSRLGAIEGAIRQIYRTRGFATAEIASAVNEVENGQVKPVITIKEGPRVVIGQVAISGNAVVPEDRLRPVLTLAPGQAYDGPSVARNRDALIASYLDEGFASADVTVAPVTPVAANGGAVADITFKVVEGPQTLVEHIFITGNLRTKSSVIERELQIQEGKPLGQGALTETRRRLSALGLFRRIQISAISHGDAATRDVVIAVEEAQQTTIGYGGGLQVDSVLRSTDNGENTRQRYELAPRGFFEVGRRNLGGRNRSLNLYSRLSLRPSPDETSTNLFKFPEYRVVATYLAPRALGNYGDLTATAAIEEGVRTGFNFIRKGLTAGMAHQFRPTIRGTVRYSFGTTRIFDEQLKEEDQLTVDRVFPQVRLSAFSAALLRDTRDDTLEPQNGAFLSADASVAARAIGSEVGFTKTFLQGFLYKNLGKPNLVFAGGARLGLARPFLQLVSTIDADGNPVIVPVGDLPASERFYAGGDTTIRGYALDSVGTPETISPNGFPIGGSAEIVLNAELRIPVHGKIGAALFVDGGNVFAQIGDLSLADLRGSVGVGGRYRSPIGPIRMDVGFKLDRRTINGNLEPRYAIHFSIGQAF
jgi:outer membrane protein assembly complex protein YaeT